MKQPPPHFIECFAPEDEPDVPGIKYRLIPFDKIAMSTSSLYRVKGLLPEQGTGVIWGAYGAFKSFWLTDASLHVALDWRYRGRAVKQGPVVYCSFEGEDGFAKRKEAFVQAHMKEEQGPVPFYLQPLTLDLINENQQLIDDIGAQCPNPAIVNFDTMARSLSGDESSNKDVGEYFRAADAIRQAFKCTVPIVHHSGYDKTHSRGATVLPSNADFEIKIEVGHPNRVTATVIKQKDGPSGHKIYSRWEEVKIGIDDEGDPITSCVLYEADASATGTGRTGVRLTNSESIALEALKETTVALGEVPPMNNYIPKGIKAVTERGWRTYAYERGISTGEGRAKQQAFKRGYEGLIAKQMVATWQGYYWVTS